ncbi:HD family hydrolase [Limnobaculum xujianqingii]|uniref:HD family hydrolase n=1 Tax=Limnobaculum xujianqingii TaxID=2738837 RepID=UPI00112A50F5|nr:HD family hydrolase [Limnobaculum xujianqingii]
MSWLTTISGKHFNYQDPDPGSICIRDIARALSHECRFAGHVPAFYSVAQHSVFVSHLVPQEFAMEALLHDAVEAYCKDIPAPLKRLLPDYQAIEHRIDLLIRGLFKLPAEHSKEVKHADLVALATERRDFGLDDGTEWPILKGITPDKELILSWPAYDAYNAFIDRFYELKNAGYQASVEGQKL